MADVSSRQLGRVLGELWRSLHWGGPMKIYQLGLITCALVTFGHAANAELKTMVVTGNVEISAGKMEINRNFTTTGNLAMTGGSITVASGKVAKFKG